MLGLSAVAVDSEIVGKDSDAKLIGGVLLLGGVVPLAARRAAWAAEGSTLDLGEVEKSWLKRLVLDVGAFMGMPPFSEEEKEEFVGEELLAKGFVGRRGIARWSERT
jgi:hypothetical protein